MARRLATTAIAVLTALVAACTATTAPTPVSDPTGPSPTASPSATDSPRATGRATSADGRVSFALPDGWRALDADDPAFEIWFTSDLGDSLRSGLITLVAVDEEGSAPGRPTYAIVAPVAEAAYAAAAARSFVDQALLAGNGGIVVSELELPAGPTRLVGVDARVPGDGGSELPSRQLTYVVRSGGSLTILVVQAIDREAGVAERAAEQIAESLVVEAPPGELPDVPRVDCEREVPIERAFGATAALPALGADHVDPGEDARYAHCPPTSGVHYPTTLLPRFHGPTEPTVPQEWVHNLEHGQVVLLYDCARGCGPEAGTLAAIARDVPPTPICGRSSALVITRHDGLPTPFALLAWHRLRYLRSVTPETVAEFIAAHGDRGPEPQCGAAEGAAASPGTEETPVPTTP